MKNLTCIIWMLLTFIYSFQSNAQVSENRIADSVVNAFMKKWKIPGGSVAVAREGKIVYSRGFGFVDENKNQTAGTNNLYRIASVSKPVTALAIMKLVEDGKLSLSDKVFGKSALLGNDYYLSVVSDPRIYSITVEQLLEHTSGWDRNVACDGYDHSD